MNPDILLKLHFSTVRDMATGEVVITASQGGIFPATKEPQSFFWQLYLNSTLVQREPGTPTIPAAHCLQLEPLRELSQLILPGNILLCSRLFVRNGVGAGWTLRCNPLAPPAGIDSESHSGGQNWGQQVLAVLKLGVKQV